MGRNDLMITIDELRKRGDYCYVLMKYVDRDFWVEKLQIYFKEIYIDNITDFNYSSCFTFLIDMSNINLSFCDNGYNEFIKQNDCAYILAIRISAIAPYATYRFCKYYYDKDSNKYQGIDLEESSTPFLKNHKKFEEKMLKFFKDHNLQVLSEDELSTIVPGVKLELKRDNVTVYNCLFEDEDM